MHYFEEDVFSLVARSPYLMLAKPRSAESTLRRALEAGDDLKHLLHEYPCALYEPLEFFYICLEGLGALDADLLDDMITSSIWQAVVWASFYAALDPRPEYAKVLQQIDFPLPYNQWIVDLALAEAGIAPPDPATEQVAELIRRVRNLLEPVPRPDIPLRLSPSSDQKERLLAERDHIAGVYKNRGADAARAEIQGTLSGYYAADYRGWVAKGCPLPPG